MTLTINSDKPVIVIPADEYEILLQRLERAEILADPQMMREIKEALQEFEEGKSEDLEEFWRREMSDA